MSQERGGQLGGVEDVDSAEGRKERRERRTLACIWLESTVSVCVCVCVCVCACVRVLIDEMNSRSMRLILAEG